MGMDEYDGQEKLLSTDPLHMIFYPLNLYSLDTVGKNYESLNLENKLEEPILTVLLLSILQTRPIHKRYNSIPGVQLDVDPHIKWVPTKNITNLKCCLQCHVSMMIFRYGQL